MLSLSLVLVTFSVVSGVFPQEHGVDVAAVCGNQVGRVAVLNTNCEKYYLCTQKNGIISASVFTCPSESKFSPVTRRCTLNYECSEAPTTVSDRNITWTPPTTPNIPENDFKCTWTGKFVNPKSSDCSSYIQCELDQYQLVATIVKCPADSSFSYSELDCVVEPKLCPPSDDRTKRICKNQGRFLNDEDATCRSYLLCISKLNQNFDHFMISKVFKCPGNSTFHAQQSRCVLDTNLAGYKCPVSNQGTTTLRPTTGGWNPTTGNSNPTMSTSPQNTSTTTSFQPITTSGGPQTSRWPSQNATSTWSPATGNPNTTLYPPQHNSTVTNATPGPTSSRQPWNNTTYWSTTSGKFNCSSHI